MDIPASGRDQCIFNTEKCLPKQFALCKTYSLWTSAHLFQPATITALPRLAAMTNAVVVPCVTRLLPGSGGYIITFYPVWESYPTGDAIADTRYTPYEQIYRTAST
jgi:hypothetical protein